MYLPSRSVLIFLFICQVAVGPAQAGRYIEQASPAGISIVGVVSDTSGAVVAGAAVDAVVAGRSMARVTTGADGSFHLDVPAGVPVEMRVHREGFAGQVIALAGASQPMTRNVTLQVGGVSDTLVVTASRASEGRASVTESVTSFTRADIEALGSA